MKKLLFFLIAIALASCSQNPKGFESKIFTEKEVSDFIRVNPDWIKNGTPDAQITEKFKHMLINLSNEPKFLADFPLQLTAITDSIVNTQSVKIAVFKSFKDDKRAQESLLNQLELEIKGIMSADQAAKLEVSKKYTITGMVYKQGKRGDVRITPAGDSTMYVLGKYLFWNLATKPDR